MVPGDATMEREVLRKLIAEVQARRMEPDAIEVKSARGDYLLKKLCDAGRLKPQGKGKWRRYVLP